MKNLIRCVPFFLLVSYASAFAREIDFKSDLCDQRPASGAADLKRFAADKQAILIKGYLGMLYGLNERASAYFLAMENAYQNLFGRDHVVNDSVDSKISITDNASQICDRLRGLAARSPDKKLLIVGHSMGGGAVAALPLVCPDLFERDLVAAAVSLNGVIGGTPVADIHFSVEDRERMERFTETRANRDDRLLAQLSKHLSSVAAELTENGIRSLGTAASLDRKRSVLSGSSVLELSRKKMFFVRSHRNPQDMPWSIRATGEFMSAMYPERSSGRNDGLVPLEDQASDELGRVLMTVRGADHLDLVIAFPWSNSRDHFGSSCRTSFAHALLRALQSEGI